MADVIAEAEAANFRCPGCGGSKVIQLADHRWYCAACEPARFPASNATLQNIVRKPAESFFSVEDGSPRFDADKAAAAVLVKIDEGGLVSRIQQQISECADRATNELIDGLNLAIGTPFVRRAVQDFITESPGNAGNWTKALTEGVFRLRLAAAFLPPGLGELAARGLDWLDVRAQSKAVAGFMAEAARAVLLPLTEQMAGGKNPGHEGGVYGIAEAVSWDQPAKPSPLADIQALQDKADALGLRPLRAPAGMIADRPTDDGPWREIRREDGPPVYQKQNE